MNNNIPPIMQVGNVLISSDLITERFCCDLDACKGACCIEGDAGAPVTLDEIAAMEDALDIVWSDLSAQAQAVIDKQGVACTDREGDLVTIVFSLVTTRGFAFVRSTGRIEQGSVRFASPYPVHSIPFAKSVSMTTLLALTITAGMCVGRP